MTGKIISILALIAFISSCTSDQIKSEMINLKVAAYKKIMTTWIFKNDVKYCSSGKKDDSWKKEDEQVLTKIREMGFQQISEKEGIPVSFVKIVSIQPQIIVEIGVDDTFSGFTAKYECFLENSEWKFKELEITQYGKKYDR